MSYRDSAASLTYYRKGDALGLYVSELYSPGIEKRQPVPSTKSAFMALPIMPPTPFRKDTHEVGTSVL